MPQPERPEVTRVSTSFGIDSGVLLSPYRRDEVIEVIDYEFEGGVPYFLHEITRPNLT